MRLLATAAALAFVAIAAWAATPAIEAAQSPGATGGWTNDVGQKTTLVAIQKADGTATGRWKSSVGGDRVGGDVTCVAVVGNKAYIGGVVTRFDLDSTVVGASFVMRVTDNGEGSGSAADSTTPVFFAPPGTPVPCDDPAFQALVEFISAGLERTVTGGNLQVHE